MSGHLRVRLSASFLVAALSTAAASSSPLPIVGQAPPAVATAQAPAEECLLQPGKSTAPGQHWVYHSKEGRKCWFQAAQETAVLKKPIHRHIAKMAKKAGGVKRGAAGPSAREPVADAHAELLRPVPVEIPQPAQSASELNVANAAPVENIEPAVAVSAAPVMAEPGSNQLTPEHPALVQADSEISSATAPPPGGSLAVSASPATPTAAPAEAGVDTRQSAASWIGALLMTLGCVSLLISALAVRIRLKADFPAIAGKDAGSSGRPQAEYVRLPGAPAGAIIGGRRALPGAGKSSLERSNHTQASGSGSISSIHENLVRHSQARLHALPTR